MTASIHGAAGESREDPGTEGSAHAQVNLGAADSGAEASSSSVSLMSGTASDRCAVCSALMTAEQRYCVECGTRRGKPRFTPAPRPGQRAEAAGRPAAPSPAERFGGNAAVAVALVIVLLALGVGFLIGDAASGTQTVRVTVAGGAQTSTPSTGASGTKTTAVAPPKTTTASSNPFPSS